MGACLSYCVPRACAGAAVLNQMSFRVAMKHKQLVAEVAGNAKEMDQSPMLGVLFDEVSRRDPGRTVVITWGLMCVFLCFMTGSIGKKSLARKGTNSASRVSSASVGLTMTCC